MTYGEGINVGYKAYDAAGITPLFPFGYGLSYTAFAYSGLQALRPAIRAPIRSDVRFVMRTPVRGRAEAAQVYSDCRRAPASRRSDSSATTRWRSPRPVERVSTRDRPAGLGAPAGILRHHAELAG